MVVKVKMKCRNCGNYNILEVKEIFLNADSSESKLKVFLPVYMPLKTENCYKCNQILATEKWIFRIKKN
jgi:hypothetical protein